MARQICYEDVDMCYELPSLLKHPTSRQLVMWAGASGDFYEMHYDKDYALNQGLPGVIVHGDLTSSFLAQLMTDWVGEPGTLKKLRTINCAMLFPHQDIICKGKVTRKFVEGNERCVECEVWAENPKGEKCVTGTAVVALPTRSKK